MVKKGKDKDVVADFFGDDVDWLDDEAEDAPGNAPPAPPKAPADVAAADATPSAPAVEAPSAGLGRVAALGNAPTLVFSTVPTLPPTPIERLMPPSERAAAAPAPTPALTPETEGSGAQGHAHTDPDIEAFGDAFEDQVPATPLVRTVEPAPLRMRVGATPEPVSRATTGPARRRPSLPALDLDDGPATWRAAAAGLVAEAAVSEVDSRGSLLVAAARVHADRLKDGHAAVALFRDAVDAGVATVDILGEGAASAALHGEGFDALAWLERRSPLLTGVARAENDVDSALLALRVARRPDQAEALLCSALAADSTDWRAAQLLRDLAAERGDIGAMVDAMAQMATMVDGDVAAEVVVDRARALEDLGRAGEALADWRTAVALRPHSLVTRAGLMGALLQDPGGMALQLRSLAESDGQGAADAWVAASEMYAAAGDEQAAVDAMGRAVAAGHASLDGEWQARRVAAEPAVLRTWLGSRASQDAHVAYRLAAFEEREGDQAAAAQAYARASIKGGLPALDGVLRGLVTAGDVDGERAHHLARLEAGYDESLARVRLAELANGGSEAWQALALLDGPLGRLGARMARTCALRQGENALVANAWREWGQQHRSAGVAYAGAVAVPVVGDLDALLGVLLVDAAFEPALDAVLAWGAPGQRLDALLRALGDVSGDESPGLAWLAAALARTLRPELANDLLERAASGGLECAASWARVWANGSRAADAWRSVATRSRGDEAVWAWYAVAVADAQRPEGLDAVSTVLTLSPQHSGALDLRAAWQASHTDPALTLAALAADERLGLTGTLRAMALALRLGQPDVVGRVGARLAAAGHRHRVAAVLAAAAGHGDVALDLLPADAFADRADWLEFGLGRAHEALAAVKALPEAGEVWTSLSLIRLGGRCGDLDARRTGLRRLVSDERAPTCVRAACSSWLAAEGDGGSSQVAALWRAVRELRPGAIGAAVRERDARIAAVDVPGVEALFADVWPDDAMGLVRALDRLGVVDGLAERVIAVSSTVGAGDPQEIAWCFEAEPILARLGAWSALMTVYQRRAELSFDEANVAELDRRRRWVLREKLADTEAAWTFYQHLHLEHPDDRDVTEALARIAAKRGETARAVQFLSDLARGSSGPAESARLMCRIGDAWLQGGDPAAARQAWFDALDHCPDDRMALTSLKQLAEAEGDDVARIAVLQREGALLAGEARASVLREVAMLQSRGASPQEAMDAWRSVLDAQPDDAVALRRVWDLAIEARDGHAMLAVADPLLQRLPEGAERSQVCATLGAEAERQGDADAAQRWNEAAITGPAPHAGAAAALEAVHRVRLDNAGIARALTALARATEGDDRVAALHRLAVHEIDARLDKDAAVAVYERILEESPDDAVALRVVVSQLYEQGRYDRVLDLGLRLEGQLADPDADDFDGRLEVTNFLFQMGDVLRRSGRIEDAIARHERTLAMNGGHLATLEAVAPLYAARQDWASAEKAFRQLIQLSGGRGERAKIASWYVQLATIEGELGRADKAQKRFEKALEIFPNFAPALKGLTILDEQRGDWSSALTRYNLIIGGAARSSDEVIDAYMSKGRLLDERLARPDKAQEHFERSLEFEANQPNAYLRLAELAMRREDYAQAAQLAETALHLNDAAGVDGIRAMLLAVAATGLAVGGNEPEATRVFSEAAGLDPELGEALGERPAGDPERVRVALRSRLPR